MDATIKSQNALCGLILPGLLLLAAGLFSAFGVIVTVPPGLNPGDTYRLVFVTDGLTAATSSDIATYNSFVTNQANAAPDLFALGTSWTIIGSTPATAAKANTLTTSIGVPIFGLDGTKIVDDNADLWDGSLDSGIRYTQSGISFTGENVWTGTNVLGDQADTGGRALGRPNPRIGRTAATGSSWVQFTGDDPAPGPADAIPQRVYGLSGTLVVAPEPGSAVLFATGFLALAMQRRRRAVGLNAMR